MKINYQQLNLDIEVSGNIINTSQKWPDIFAR